MCRNVSPVRPAKASSDATSSPGSIKTASLVVSQPTTKPFLKNGPTACVSIIMVIDDFSRSRRPHVQLEDQDRCQPARRRPAFFAFGRRCDPNDAQESDDAGDLRSEQR